jgi:hypothetical protein
MNKRILFLSFAGLFRCTLEPEAIEPRDVAMRLCPCPTLECSNECIKLSNVGESTTDGSASPKDEIGQGGMGGTIAVSVEKDLQLGCVSASHASEWIVGDTHYLRVSLPPDQKKLKSQDRLVEVEASGPLVFVRGAEEVASVSEYAPNVACDGEDTSGMPQCYELVFPVRATGLGTGVLTLKRPYTVPVLSFSQSIRERGLLGLIQSTVPVSEDSSNLVGTSRQLEVEGLVTICSSAPAGEKVEVSATAGATVPEGLSLEFASGTCPTGYGASVTFPVSSTVFNPRVTAKIGAQSLNCALQFDSFIETISVTAEPLTEWLPAPGETRLQTIQVSVEGTAVGQNDPQKLAGVSVVVLNDGVTVLGETGVTNRSGKVSLILSVAKDVGEFGLALSVAGRTQVLLAWSGPTELRGVGGAGETAND